MVHGNHVIPNWQLEIRERCHHPHGGFSAIPYEDLNGSIPDRFARIVNQHPRRTAIRSPSCEYTYEALARRSDIIARVVLDHASDTTPVALLYRHDAEIIVAMIAVLKAGRHYLIVDLDEPKHRALHILKDCSVELLMTDQESIPHVQSVVSSALSAGIDLLDTSTINTNSYTKPTHAKAIHPDKPAQISYTSGSTGLPKGFTHTHRHILHDVRQYTNTAHYSYKDRFLLVSVPSFSDSIRTIYGALMNGGMLLPFSVKEYGLTALQKWTLDQEITIYRSVPTLFRCLMSSLDLVSYPSVRLVILSGEPAYKSDFELFKKSFSDECILLNRLGTSEALTYTMLFLDKKIVFASRMMPVGYPTPDKEVLLQVEKSGRLSKGGTGHIVVRSRYMTPGYLTHPALNAKIFPPDLAQGEKKAYLSGDLGRFLPDGCLIHLGRIDTQVKINGYRVELGEIESTLTDHPYIEHAAVIVAKSPTPKLAAFIKPSKVAHISTKHIKRYLRTRLPEYMVPSYWTLLEHFPTTRTGKIARGKLPPPDRTSRIGDNLTEVHDLSDIECELSTIWVTVLKIPDVPKTDGFLDLGGDSIAALQISTLTNRLFSIEIPPSEFLRNINLSENASIIERQLNKTTNNSQEKYSRPV